MFKSSPQACFWLVVWSVGMIGILIVSLYLCDGHFNYTLDDPYIHLAVAHNILNGTYGINLGEPASPVSSMIYPLLLLIPLLLGFGIWAPLFINVIAMGFSVWLLIDFFWRYDINDNDASREFGHIVCPLLILAINAFGLPMTGMEHSLHVLAVILVLRGLVFTVEQKRAPLSLIIAIGLMPFIRFEGLALTAAALCLLIYLHQTRAAAISLALLLAGSTLWALVMIHMGLSIFPSSIMTKSALAAAVHDGKIVLFVESLFDNFSLSFRQRWGSFFALAIFAFIPSLHGVVRGKRLLRSGDVVIATACIVALAAHLCAGSYGWFHRYEVYADTILIMGSIYLFRHIILRIDRAHNRAAQVAIVIALCLLVVPYAKAALVTPVASRNIYEQHYQMHRFATEYFPHSVAVNDLGWVAYNNPHYVLDLWGLGSETVRQRRALHTFDETAVTELTENAHVDFAMVYDSWLGSDTPKDWCLRAIMQSEQVTAGDVNVMFYVTHGSDAPAMDEALDQFEPSLPPRVNLKRIYRACP